MDTRTKILTPAEVASRYASYAVVLASFDVLTASRIQSLQTMCAADRPLIAVLTEIPGSLLSLQARAELAASLAIIKGVVPGGDTANLLTNASIVFDERAADAARTAELIEHVERRTRS